MKLKSNIGILSGKLREAAEAAARKTAVQIVGDVSGSFAEAKSGRTYNYGRASAPGEAPAIKTGDLITSTKMERRGAARYRAGVTDDKAIMLEYGTARMAPRPFITPAAETANRNLRRNIKDEFKKVK